MVPRGRPGRNTARGRDLENPPRSAYMPSLRSPVFLSYVVFAFAGAMAGGFLYGAIA